eukprot:202954-Pleurochrysis_carterae.AAC.1
MHAHHGPVWLMPSIKELHAHDSCAHITFPLCALGGHAQKYTTFLCTPGLQPVLGRLASLTCTHRSHVALVGGSCGENGWNSASHAAYPPDLNMIIAKAIAGRITLNSAPSHSRNNPPHREQNDGFSPSRAQPESAAARTSP